MVRIPLFRYLPWIFGLLMLGLAAVIVLRSLRWKADRESHETSRAEAPGDPREVELYNAMKLEMDGKLKEAVAAYGKILEREPGTWLAVEGRSNAYLALGRDEEALRDLQRLSELRPNDMGPWMRMAHLHVRAKRFDQARALAEKVSKARPELADPYLVLSDLEAERDPTKSVALLEQYLKKSHEGMILDTDQRAAVDAVANGTYTRRVIRMFRDRLPEGPDRDLRAELEARWHMAHQHLDFSPLLNLKHAALAHLQIYLDLARTRGDPDPERFAKAKSMAERIKEEIQREESQIQGS